ncbi:hypothetical protein QYE76_060271 [Lolium multiflorum]|uniref:Uncharacterized protein n=1 Tax=Lolium multiflorum TaxID=4521 RepID=A0AAD8W3M4_LOLMU|nr:hypothetical protein QYE76_060271 [Lolium multiflorum]
MSSNKSKVELVGEDALQPTLPLKGKQAEVLALPFNIVITPSQIRDLMLPPPQLTNCVTEPETKVFTLKSRMTENQRELVLAPTQPPKSVREPETKVTSTLLPSFCILHGDGSIFKQKKKIFKLAGDNGITEAFKLRGVFEIKLEEKNEMDELLKNFGEDQFKDNEDAVAKRHELLLDCERLREENLTLNGKLNQAIDDAMLAESNLVDAYMKRSEMRNTLLDLKDKLTRFRNSNDNLRKKINELRTHKRLVEAFDQLVNLT